MALRVSLLLTFLVAASPAPAADTPAFSPQQVEFYEKQVLPILQAHCLKCHGAEEKIKGGLRLTSRAAVLQGGDSGPAVDLAKPEASVLIEAINYKGFEMPPAGKLPAAQIAVLTKWVKDGLAWNAKSEPAPPKKPSGIVIDDAARSYWAYQPVKRVAPPAVKDAAWPKSDVDRFILAKVEDAGLKPVGTADPIALVRRVFYDLTGLPPSPQDVAAFVADPSPAAYERLIDRLLDSPQYGEKWGRHWLDVVRYAESHGYERDNPKPFAWRYRDYVINAFNADKPYDRFLLEQLAGDELDPPSTESIIATGFYRLGIWDDEPADRPLAKYDVLDGVVSTTSQAVLAMSLNCCRCHDHKKDPLPQRDYYRFLAFFRDVSDMNVKNTRKLESDSDRQSIARQLAERQAASARLYGEQYRLEQDFKAVLAKRGLADDAAESDLADLSYRFYRDTWDKLPDFDGLKFEDEGRIADGFLSLDPASRPEAIGLVYEAKLKVPAAGEYTFDLDATEGVRLLVGGQRVIDQPAKGRHTVRETTTLAAGLLPLRLEYFNTNQKPKLSLAWSGPGLSRRFLTDDGPAKTAGRRVFIADSRKDGQTWSYTFEKPADGWQQPTFDAKWKSGPGGFGTRGTPGSVVRTEWSSPDIWLRTSFELDTAASLPTQVTLLVHHDEDCEIFLNGTQVMAAKGFLRDYETELLSAESLRALKPGRNVLAVHCRQTGGGQYIDVGLVEGRGGPTEKLPVAQLIRQHASLWEPVKVQRHAELTRQLEQLRQQPAPEGGLEVMCVEEAGRSVTNVLLRGNPALVGDKVEPGFPTVLGAVDPVIPPREGRTSGKRRALAEWLTSKSNPLTARVFANRLWQHHFGRGLVPTPNDFGLLGEQPSHPELLDWLANEFMAGDWRIKRMHKLLLLSATYRLSSRASDDGLRLDPANRLFWRFNMRRLTAEELRDSFLAVAGVLNLKSGGPPIYPPIPREVLAGQSRPGSGWGNSPPDEAARRSVYIHIKRSLLFPLLSDYDAADTDSSCPVRYATTVATQALNLLNGQFSQEQASAFARRLTADAPGRLADQVRRAILLTTSRTPTDEEVARDVAFVERLQTDGLKPEQAFTYYCLLALNTNEFVYLD